ncbi:MAG: DUF2461 domain-containing protein [Breznakibacter sp.]
MVPQNILDFLAALTANNTREWFSENKAWYQRAKDEFETVTLKTIALVRELDPSVGYLAPNDCTFRIYRDTRFSHDKQPYKTNMGVFVTRGGKKSPFGGYYLHLEPGACFLSGGIYIPEPRVLNAVRQEIYHLTNEYKQIVENPRFKAAFGQLDGEKLKTAPKGFDKNWPDIELIKFKSYNTTHMLSDAEVLSPAFEQKAKELFGLMVPFNNFLNRVIADLEE